MAEKKHEAPPQKASGQGSHEAGPPGPTPHPAPHSAGGMTTDDVQQALNDPACLEFVRNECSALASGAPPAAGGGGLLGLVLAGMPQVLGAIKKFQEHKGKRKDTP